MYVMPCLRFHLAVHEVVSVGTTRFQLGGDRREPMRNRSNAYANLKITDATLAEVTVSKFHLIMVDH